MEDILRLYRTKEIAPKESLLDFATLQLFYSAISRISNQSIFIIDFDNHKTLSMTDDLIYINEAVDTDYKRTGDNPYWSLIPDTDFNTILHLKTEYPQIIKSLSSEDYSRHICIVDFPILLKERKFYITQKYTPLSVRSDGSANLGLFSIMPSNEKSISCKILSPSGIRWKYDFVQNTFIEDSKTVVLSDSEKALLQRAKKGMSNNEIASDLCISVSTVKSHKQKIFKKLNVNSIAEALVIVGNYHLL